METRQVHGAATALEAGSRLGEFEIVRTLGSGGFGVTYLAQDAILCRSVAVKEYLPSDCGRRKPDGTVGPTSASTRTRDDYAWGLDRFLLEARTLARLDDAGIVRVHRIIEAAGTAYIVMEYIEGRTLAEAIREQGPMPEAAARPLLAALARGLANVHAASLLHRDIKPQNVMLRAPGDAPVLIDFGAARQQVTSRSHPMSVVLTPGYAPIEQYASKGRSQGPWTDIYALGAVAYFVLTGRIPDDSPTRAQHDELEPVQHATPHAVGSSLADAVHAALAVDARDRPRDLDRWLAMLNGADRQERAAPSTPVPAQSAGNYATPLLVGRDPGCDIRLRDGSVSRRHAQLTRLPGGVYVTDLGSTNGTWVLQEDGWCAVQEALVGSRDRLRFGDCEATWAELTAHRGEAARRSVAMGGQTHFNQWSQDR